MDTMQTPTSQPSLPPTPPPYRRSMSYGLKIFLLGLQCAVLMIGALIVWIISESRDYDNMKVSNEIAENWGGPAIINGPTILEYQDSLPVIQKTFDCKAIVDTKSLHRNIYEAEVFNARISLSGSIDKKNLKSSGDSIYFKFFIDKKKLSKVNPLKTGKKETEWSITDDFILAKVNISDLPQVIEYSTEIDIRGSQSLQIFQIGEKSEVVIEGIAANPSFGGNRLPDDRTIDGNKFFAKWLLNGNTVSSNSRGYNCSSVETDFLVGVDRYQKVNRSLKYAFIIIVLTYISALFTEVILKYRIPLLNYFLIGVALIIFYILLLSFSEHLSFGIAYLIASSMTVALISGYMWKMLDSKIVGAMIGAILTIIYGSCFILLSLSTYSLLLGSTILFIALASMMYASLKLKI